MPFIGHGTTVTFTGFTAEITNIDGPGMERDDIDVTHMATGDNWKRFIMGLTNAGEVTLTGHFDPSTLPPINGAQGSIAIAFPTTPVKTWSNSAAALKSFNPSVPDQDKCTFTATFKLSGAVTVV